MPAFILEIGTEELPARFLAATEGEMARRFTAALEEAGLVFHGLSACSTPRRLALFIGELAEQAATREEVVTGPPFKAAYDMGGRPTRAAEGFARTQQVALEETFTLETEKGAYLAVRKRMGGGDALVLLSRICPEIIAALPFPKRMRWGGGDFSFARPIRWILAMLGSLSVPFAIGPIASGNGTCGHRVHGPGPMELDDAANYFSLMERGGVVPERASRRRAVIEQGDALAAAKNGSVLWNEALLDEVEGLCEHPLSLLGSFDSSYLELPREVLLTSMESNQKSFGLESENGRLLPHFLTVLNLTPSDVELVRKGWERVLRARLEDARFFWKTDLASGFAPWLRALDSVIFLAPLGSMGDKARRVGTLCAWLAKVLASACSAEALSPEEAARAGNLSKADLVSAMVKEFDTLQGIMGSIYAARSGETRNVAKGIAEQYLPAGPDSPVPSSLCGAIVSIADKADTLVGCFGLGMIPTGTADPYALRRAALGIARIAQERSLRFSTTELFAKALEGYGQRDWKILPEQALPRLGEFFTLRLKNHLIAGGADTLLAEAALLADASDVRAATARLDALTAFSKTPDFAQNVLTFKRAANIIRKQSQDTEATPDGRYHSELLVDEAEKALAAALERLAPRFDTLWQEDRFTELFALLGELHPFVDAFFANVMVMCDDPALRLNRLNLLKALVSRLGRLADFAALQM